MVDVSFSDQSLLRPHRVVSSQPGIASPYKSGTWQSAFLSWKCTFGLSFVLDPRTNSMIGDLFIARKKTMRSRSSNGTTCSLIYRSLYGRVVTPYAVWITPDSWFYSYLRSKPLLSDATGLLTCEGCISELDVPRNVLMCTLKFKYGPVTGLMMQAGSDQRVI